MKYFPDKYYEFDTQVPPKKYIVLILNTYRQKMLFDLI